MLKVFKKISWAKSALLNHVAGAEVAAKEISALPAAFAIGLARPLFSPE